MPLNSATGSLRKAWLALILFVGTSLSLQAQLVADFTPDKVGGCSPLAVTFTNTTTGADASAIYTWNFGNGNSITTNNPNTPVAATYFAPQTYTVTLTVKDGAQVSTKSITLTVYNNPVVNFQLSDTSGCAPLSTTLTSLSTAGTGFISGFFWDFGDGNTLHTTSNTTNYVYNFPGTYSVNLTVTNSFGCFSTLLKTNAVTVLAPVVPAFSTDSTSICSLNDPVQFTNLSSGPGPLSYAWNFGDGSNSTSPNPSHQYANKGVYNVQLTVTSPQGCTATLVKTAYVNAAAFAPQISTTSPICNGAPAQFTDISVPPPTGASQWTFGDGSSGSGSPVAHTYASVGSYTVTLTDHFGVCLDTVQQVIQVLASPPPQGFLLNEGGACQAPMLVSFTDTSLSAVKWLWNFTGNPSDTSTQMDPSFLYTTANLFNPTLTLTYPNGCAITVTEPLNTSQPTAQIIMDTTLTASSTICAIVTAQFSAISQDTLAQYSWSFGDGTTSTSATPTHTYSVPGTYIINLNFVTNHGCAGVAFPPDTVRVYPKPVADFTALDSMPCAANQLETFTNLDDSSAQFFWIYGDGTSDINNNVVHTHQYNFTGQDTMTLIASSPGCTPDTSVITRFLVNNPVPVMTAANTCDTTRMTVQFTDAPPGASEYIWSYGDGTTDSSSSFIPIQTHTYAQAGTYTATLTGIFGPCVMQSNPVPVYVLAPQHPVLSSPLDTICESNILPVQISGMDTNYQSVANGAGSYYHIVAWQYGDGTTFTPQGPSGFKTTYNGNLTNLKPGEDSLRVITQSKFFGCFDTSNYIPIYITGPAAGFTTSGPVCYPLPVIFADTSKPTNGVPIVKWQWNFGDGTDTTVSNNDTVDHAYAFPGNYMPSLTVTDSNGCSGTVTSPLGIVVNGPKADFYWNPSAITLGLPVTFFNSSTAPGGATYFWHFSSDGFTSTNPISLNRTYLLPIKDTVELIATGSGPGSCSDTTTQIVIAPQTTASFVFTQDYVDFANCPPMVAYFTSTTSNADSLIWTFGDGSSAENNPNPSHTYNLPGVYLVTLTAYGPVGTFAVYQDSVTVRGPVASFKASLLQACIPAIETLSATSSSLVNTYIWDFGDGTVISTNDSIASHTYIIPGVFTPNLVITDSSGCQVNFALNQKILMDSLAAQLGPNITMCNPGMVGFVPLIYSMARDSLHDVLTMHWNFGTGQPADTSNALNPQFDFVSPGVYPVTLQVQSPPGCSVTAMDTVTIVAPINLQYTQNLNICAGSVAQLDVTGADNYTWTPDSSLNNIVSGRALADPHSTTTYTVIGTDSSHCFTDTASITVQVMAAPTVQIQPVGAVPGGSSTNLVTMASPDVVSWSWSPANYLSCTNCSSPTCLPLAPITYTVTVTNANGCTATDTVSIKLACSENAVHIPNAFTPNNDGNNDLFYPICRGIQLIKFFQVYNRWGQQMYAVQNITPGGSQFGWNGTFNGTLQPPGTYVYMCSVECFTGETFLLKGTVELIR